MQYGWEGLGSQRMRVSLLGFVYKIGEIIVASSDNSGVEVVRLLCVGQNVAGSNFALYFDFYFPPLEIFLSSYRISVH